MSAEAFLNSREFLWRHRTDYDTAYRDFRWPVLDKFNWALDYFDRMAYGNNRPALWIVNEGGGEFKLSFAEMAELSACECTAGRRLAALLAAVINHPDPVIKKRPKGTTKGTKGGSGRV